MLQHLAFAVTLSALFAFLAGCGSTYCQSGPRYGTQCYDVHRPESGAPPIVHPRLRRR